MYREKGVDLKTNKKVSKTILTTSGPVTFSRYALVPRNAEGRAILRNINSSGIVFPLDEALGIDRLPFRISQRMMLEIAYWAVKLDSYQETEEYFRDKCQVQISDDTIRKAVNFVGRMVYEDDIQAANDDYEKLNAGKLHYNPSKNAVLYILADGSMVNTRKKDANGSTWRENKLGLVFSSDNFYYWKDKSGENRHRIEKREYISLLGGAADFKKMLFHTALRNGYGKYKNVVILSDGAAWIRNMKEELFPDAQQILDRYHAKENTYTFAKAIFKNNEEKYIPWAEDICKKLDAGHCDEILRILSPYEGKSFGNGTVNLHTYLSNNKDNIDYPAYEQKGYFVGSGAIESGNKIAVQDRLKLPGMRWNEETAQYVLSIKAKIESKLWEKETVPLLLKKMGERI